MYTILCGMPDTSECITVRISKEDLEALDRVVKLTGLGDTRGGRSTAVRSLMAPWLEAIKLAESGASKLEVASKCFVEMQKMSDLVVDASEAKRVEKDQMNLDMGVALA